MAQKVLITGASSGFGKLTASTLLKAGHAVVASMREPHDRNKPAAEELNSQGAHIVEIDVTDDDSVISGVAEAMKIADGIDVLVNNAGKGALGLLETFDIDDWKKMFELNVFGVQRMNRAILPHFRERHSGLLIHVSSMLGRFVMPFLGPYSASKAALEMMADNYRVELSSLGIESIIVEPGAFGTPFHSNRMHYSDKERAASYGDYAEVPERQAAGYAKRLRESGAPDPQMVADAILKLIEMPRGTRPFRTVAEDQGAGPAIRKYNQAAEEMMQAIYSATGRAEMLDVK